MKRPSFNTATWCVRLRESFSSRLPQCVTLDDLISAGTIGLIHAAHKYDPSRGIAFTTYARHRILGAMLDFLREEDPLSRTARHQCQKADPQSISSVTVSLEELPEGILRDVRRSGAWPVVAGVSIANCLNGRVHPSPPYQNRIKTPSEVPTGVACLSESRLPKYLKTQNTGWNS